MTLAELLSWGSRLDPEAYTDAPPAIAVGPRPLSFVTHLEPRWGPWPFGTLQPVIAIPAISPTAAPGRTPWEQQLGDVGYPLNESSTTQPQGPGAKPTISGG